MKFKMFENIKFLTKKILIKDTPPHSPAKVIIKINYVYK